MAIANLNGNICQILTIQKGAIAMRRIKIATKEEIIKNGEEVFGPIKGRIVDMVLGVLGGIKESLEEELSGIGLMVMRAVMELEITQVAGVKGQRQRNRAYHWWGTNPGSVVLDGAKVKIAVPRAVEAGTQKAYQLQSYGFFRRTGELVKQAYRDLIRGVSTRRYGEGVTQFLEGYGVSASTVSRRMVKATMQKVKELLERSLAELELAVLMIDGVRVGDQTVVVAIGIDIEGFKHVLGIWQGSTENARVAKSLLEELVDRGLDVNRPLLVVMDGSKALRRAVTDVLGAETPVQRCIVHKKRNVLEELPKQYHRQVSVRMTRAYNLVSEEEARKELLDLALYLDSINPSAAKSLREGLDETLTLHRLGIPDALRRSLQSTNIAESAIAVVRQRTRNVKRWPDGGRRSPKADQVQRWVGAGLLEAEKNFRRVNGYAAMMHLVNALTRLRENEQNAA